MKCNICGKPIVLNPSAKERSKKYGKPVSFYKNLFKSHSECEIEKRKQETKNLLKRLYNTV